MMAGPKVSQRDFVQSITIFVCFFLLFSGFSNLLSQSKKVLTDVSGSDMDGLSMVGSLLSLKLEEISNNFKDKILHVDVK